MFLVINTVERDRILLGLSTKDKLIKKVEMTVGFGQAEKLLPLIDKLLKARELKDLKGVIVATGPGGFSAVRLGVLATNVLSYSLKIPSFGLKTSEFKNLEDLARQGIKKLKGKKGFALLQPFYGSEPNITKSKKRRLRR